MSYLIKLVSPVERGTFIAKAIGGAVKTHPFHDFRSQRYDLPVIRIGIDYPLYRMENFRTYTDQHEHLAKEKLPNDYFIAGQELESAQQVQHKLLLRLAKRGVADSVVPVFKVLEQEGQREPILITSAGVVINGNRRLAAMRELGVSHVDVMVLPIDATSDEIVDIEASLQGKPETKLEYDWIGHGQLINRLCAMGRTTKQVADQLRRNEKDIKNSRWALIEADLYLKEWANAEGEYARISGEAEQLFKNLPKCLENKDAALAHASRVIAWTLFDNRDKLTGRIYNYNAAFGALATDVLDRVATTLELPTTGNAQGEVDNGDFSIDFEDDTEIPKFETIINALTKESNREEAVKALIDASLTSIEVAKGQRDGGAALKALAEANAKIFSVDLTRASPKTFAGIGKQLTSIESLLTRLKVKLQELGKE